MLEWYFPWSQLDWVLRIELVVWLIIIAASYWVFWRTVVRKRPWLNGGKSKRR